MAFTPKTEVDWDCVERMYREGMYSNQTIASDHGITEGAVRKRAKAGGWVKLDAKTIRDRAHTKADDAAVPRYLEPTPERVEALATIGGEVLVRHRTMSATLAGLVATMSQQLITQTEHEDELGEIIEDYYSQKAANAPLLAAQFKQQCNSALHAIGLNGRSKTLVNLTNASGKLVEIERKAWRLDDDDQNRSYEDLLAEIHAKVHEAA